MGVVHGAPGGIIPAFAGSTTLAVEVSQTRRDHPRIRGEHSTRRMPASTASRIIPAFAGSTLAGMIRSGSVVGSSPHSRGAQSAQQSRPDGLGIIPAFAGSTHGRSCRESPRPDHPRIRGEHPLTSSATNCAHGSSPHSRGARPSVLRPTRRRGIIPAFAGSTVSAEMRAFGQRGSSPHSRGARRVAVAPGSHRGIIPAFAGSTRG